MTLKTTKIANPPAWTGSSHSYNRTTFQVELDGIVRAHVVLPQGFGKPYELRDLSGNRKAEVRGLGSRRFRGHKVENPVQYLAEMVEDDPTTFRSLDEIEAANRAHQAEVDQMKAEGEQRKRAWIGEGARLICDLLAIADKLHGDDADLLRTAARKLQGAYPPGTYDRALEMHTKVRA